eukprot:6202562-Pleurochrysis_carterae.AAC.1
MMRPDLSRGGLHRRARSRQRSRGCGTAPFGAPVGAGAAIVLVRIRTRPTGHPVGRRLRRIEKYAVILQLALGLGTAVQKAIVTHACDALFPAASTANHAVERAFST